jgi:hypothetical protein
MMLLNNQKKELVQMSISPVHYLDRKKLSNTLYKFAWAIEILAVCIGLTIAIMMMMASFTESMAFSGNKFGVMQISNVIIAGLPFIMVAVTELTKIPFAQASYYTTSKIWKFIFSLALILISFITFESAFNGFERNDASLNYAIDKLRNDVNKIDETIPPKQRTITELSELTIDKIELDFTKQTENFLNEKQEKIEGYNQQISELRASVLSESSELIQKKINDKNKDITTLRRIREQDIKAERDNVNNKLSSIDETLNKERISLQEQLSSLRTELNTEKNRLDQALSEKGIFDSERAIRDTYQPTIKQKNQEIREIRDEINSINPLQVQTDARNASQKNIDEIRRKFSADIKRLESQKQEFEEQLNRQIGSKEQDISPQINRLQLLIDKAEKQYDVQQTQNLNERQRLINTLSNQKEKITELRNEILELETDKIDLRDQINLKVAENQIWRFAQKIFGTQSAADLRREQVQLVANIFYGSLAALVALTGVMLAFASFVANDPKHSDRDLTKPSEKISIRFIFIKALTAWRRYTIYAHNKKKMIRTPVIKEIVKEVVKEVPVQKVVLTEKPVQIIRKELVYVPMYTNDKTLLKTNSGINIPSEFEDDETKLDNDLSENNKKEMSN